MKPGPNSIIPDYLHLSSYQYINPIIGLICLAALTLFSCNKDGELHGRWKVVQRTYLVDDRYGDLLNIDLNDSLTVRRFDSTHNALLASVNDPVRSRIRDNYVDLKKGNVFESRDYRILLGHYKINLGGTTRGEWKKSKGKLWLFTRTGMPESFKIIRATKDSLVLYKMQDEKAFSEITLIRVKEL